MPFSDSNDTARIYQLFNLPRGGQIYKTYGAIDTLFGPYGEEYDISEVTDKLVARLAATTAQEDTHIGAAIDEYELILFSMIRISKSATGSEGEIVDHPQRTENIRKFVANILGMDVPEGGFLQKDPRRRVDK